jgi:uncharacterized protein YukE
MYFSKTLSVAFLIAAATAAPITVNTQAVAQAASQIATQCQQLNSLLQQIQSEISTAGSQFAGTASV